MKLKPIYTIVLVCLFGCSITGAGALAWFGWQRRSEIQRYLQPNATPLVVPQPNTTEVPPATEQLSTAMPVATDTIAATLAQASQTAPAKATWTTMPTQTATATVSPTPTPTPTPTRVYVRPTATAAAVCNPGEWLSCGGSPGRVSCAQNQVGYCTEKGQWACIPDPGKCGP